MALERGKYIDLVCSGCDFSGTSTQIKGLAKFLFGKSIVVKDLRGTELQALFHSEKFQNLTNSYFNYQEFKNDKSISLGDKLNMIYQLAELNNDLQVASFLKNEITSYINPDSADAWVMEEPPKRGSGQTNRVIEQNRPEFGSELNSVAAALSHQNYRTAEFLRFRQPLRLNNQIILRSRSEEAACYQIFNEEQLPDGISREEYLALPGHKVAFGNAPTHLFIVHGPENWKAKDYLKLKKERQRGRIPDDLELNVPLQLLVNKRYATDWMENLYEEGCKMHGGKVPKISRFSIYDSVVGTQEKMNAEFEKILKEYKQL